jgi:hypothetical protein
MHVRSDRATAEYSHGEPRRTSLQARMTALDRLLGLPRTPWAKPWRSQLVVSATGVPGVAASLENARGGGGEAGSAGRIRQGVRPRRAA